MWKGVAHPYAAQSAIQAFQMARAGLTGPPAVVEGEGGFAEVIADGPVDFDALGGRDGAEYRITKTNIKPFACGYFMQSPIEAVRDIVDEHSIDPAEISEIVVRTFDQAAQVLASPEKWETDHLNRETADHSIPYAIGVVVAHGDVPPREFRPDRLNDERIHELIGKVTVDADDDLTEYRRTHPGAIPSTVDVRAGGEIYESRVEYPIGHSERPMTDEQLKSKARAQTEAYPTDDELHQLFETCQSLTELSDVSKFAQQTVV